MASLGWTAPTAPLQQYSQADVDQAAQQTAGNALGLQRTSNVLADLGTLRANAPALAAGDPTARAQLLGMDPSVSGPAIQSMDALNASRRQAMQFGAGIASSTAGNVIGLPADQQPGAYSVLRQHAITAGMDPSMLPEQFPGTQTLLSLRNMAVPIEKQIELNASVPTTNPGNPLAAGIGGMAPPGTAALGDHTPGMPGTFIGALQQSESADPTAINARGYAGSFQFGEGRLNDLGLYTPAPGENTAANRWQGTFNIPGHPDVRTVSDFLASPGAQIAAVGSHVANIDQAIASTPGTQGLSTWGLRAVAHLGGVAGMQRFVASNGLYDPSDGRTRLSDYYNRFAAMQQANMPQQGSAQQASAAPAYSPVGTPAPAQYASIAGTSGMPQVASDVSPAPAPARVGLGSALAGLGAPAPSALGSYGASAQPSPSLPTMGGALANVGQPGTATMSQPAPAASQLTAPPGSRPLYVGGRPMMVEGRPGYVMAQAPDGSRTAMPLPGGGPDLDQRQVGGNLYGINKQTGAVVSQMPLPGAPVEGRPGFQYVQGADGSMQAAPIPGAPPDVDIRPVGNQLLAVDKQTGQILSRQPIPDTSRMSWATGPNGQQIGFQSGQPVTSIGANTLPAQTNAYEKDQAAASELATAGRDAEGQISKALEVRNLANGLPTGAGGERRAAIANVVQTYLGSGAADFLKKQGVLPDAAQSQEAAKVMLGQAGTDERSVAGGRGGLGLTQLFQRANPNLDLQPDAIRDISNLKAVTAQASKDYIDGAVKYVNSQGDQFLHNGQPYQPLTNYDQQWLAKPNVQNYMAAISAMNGKPFTEWSKNLDTSSSDQVRQVVGIINRIDPNAASTVAQGIPGARTEAGVVGQPALAAAPRTPQPQSIGQIIAPGGQPAPAPASAPSDMDSFLRRSPTPASAPAPRNSPQVPLSQIISRGSPGAAAPASQAPIRVTSPAQAMQLPPGTAIVLPDGTLGTVPGRAAAP